MQACPDGISLVSIPFGDVPHATFRYGPLSIRHPPTVSRAFFLHSSSLLHGVWRSTSLAFIGYILPQFVIILHASQTFHFTPLLQSSIETSFIWQGSHTRYQSDCCSSNDTYAFTILGT